MTLPTSIASKNERQNGSVEDSNFGLSINSFFEEWELMERAKDSITDWGQIRSLEALAASYEGKLYIE